MNVKKLSTITSTYCCGEIDIMYVTILGQRSGSKCQVLGQVHSCVCMCVKYEYKYAYMYYIPMRV